MHKICAATGSYKGSYKNPTKGTLWRVYYTAKPGGKRNFPKMQGLGANFRGTGEPTIPKFFAWPQLGDGYSFFAMRALVVYWQGLER